MAGAGVNVARQLGHGGRLPRRHVSSRDGRARPRTEVAAVDAILQARSEPASDASGFDRIVGVMFAPRSYDALPSNRGRGATMGPPACPLQSPPVPFRRRRRVGLQGLIASWGDWRGQKVFLIRKRSQVRVLDRPLAGIHEFAAFGQLTGIWVACRLGEFGCSMGPHGAISNHRRAGKRSWLHLALGSVRTRRAPSRHVPSKGCGGDHELWLLRAQQRTGRRAGRRDVG